MCKRIYFYKGFEFCFHFTENVFWWGYAAMLYLWAPVVYCPSVRPSINFSHFHRLLENNWTNSELLKNVGPVGRADENLSGFKVTFESIGPNDWLKKMGVVLEIDRDGDVKHLAHLHKLHLFSSLIGWGHLK